MTKITYIPGEIANAAIDEHGNRKPVTRTQHIFDDAKGKSQADVNADVDDSLADRYTKSETYNKAELNSMITTPNQQYVSVTATDQTTDVTDVLPATGAANTIYRVGNWDGSQFDTSVYSEYSWDDSQYVHLNTKSQIGEVFDISAYHATGGELAKYADLTAALGTDGANIPQSIRKGGMSVKFVQSSDNKYVQYRLMAQLFSVNITDWQGVDNDELISVDKEIATINSVYLENVYVVPYSSANYAIRPDGTFGSREDYKHIYIPVIEGEKYHIDGISDYGLNIAFATAPDATAGGTIPIVSGTNVVSIPANTSIWVRIPLGCTNLLLYRNNVDTGFDVKKAVMVDTKPIKGSKNFVTSSGTKQCIDDILPKVISKNEKENIIETRQIQNSKLNRKGQIETISYQSNSLVKEYTVIENKVYIITGRIRGEYDSCMYSFQDENSNTIFAGCLGDGGPSKDYTAIDMCPSGAVKLFVHYNNNNTNASVSIVSTSQGWAYKTLIPSWIGGNTINFNREKFEFGKNETYALQYIHSRIYRVLKDTTIKISGLSIGKFVDVIFYDSQWTRVKTINIHQDDDASTDDVVVNVTSDCAYFVLSGCYVKDAKYYRDLGLSISMFINIDNPYSFAPRPTDDGYQHLTMCVGINNKASNSYTPSNELQVETEYFVDNGILCLPTSYSEDGEPTRLIVFTHGHGVIYNNGATRFNSQDIKPEYWLSEGYAIMDMDGSVTGTFSGNYDYEPAAINAYETAYQWIVRHYNIRTDGVFSTGRSMGGGMQFSLIKASSIPIIASAPMVPLTSVLGYLILPITGAARKEILKAYGVPSSILDAVTWTSAETPYYNLTQDEKDIIVEYQRLYAPYAPGYCINRPYTNAELEDWAHAWNSGDEAYLQSLTNSIKDSINVAPYKNVPIRMYTCVGDPSVKYRTVTWMHEVLSRAGFNVQIHVFPATQDHSSISDHRFEINPENLITYTNSKGITLTDVPKVYIETLAFWRCYENQDSQV